MENRIIGHIAFGILMGCLITNLICIAIYTNDYIPLSLLPVLLAFPFYDKYLPYPKEKDEN